MFEELNQDVVKVAKRLLGCHLIRKVNGKTIEVKIVETEAYHQSDAASHSYRGKTERNKVMFGKPGYAYVYFTYGMHYCMNIVVGDEGEASAVLIRAVEPVSGESNMRQLRKGKEGIDLSNGPAKLCQALAINKSLNGHDLNIGPLQLVLKKPVPANKITETKRIGIKKEQEKPWRFYITNNPYVSKK